MKDEHGGMVITKINYDIYSTKKNLHFDTTLSTYLHKHTTSAVKVFFQLVTLMLLGQD